MTQGRREDINRPVKAKLLVSLCASMALATETSYSQQAGGAGVQPSVTEAEIAAEQIPPEVQASAVAAVGKLGEEVVLGHYQVAVDRMNPLWKERTAQRMGGMEALEKQLAMVQQGISMISCKPEGAPISYEVAPGKKVVKENGANVEKFVHTKWLVMVPTVTRFRIFPAGATKAMVINSTSFQVAICDKGGNAWTFIDGANLNASDLCGLFPTLPKNMQLPPVRKQEVQ